MKLGLDGKVVWVTGATGALGREIALGFAAEGARVGISARTPDALDSLSKEIKEATNADVWSLPVDVTDVAAVADTASSLIEKAGRIDVLVTTVAVPAFGPFLEINNDAFQAALNVKYLGYINCIHAVLPHMVQMGGGAVVGITGTGGRQPIGIHLPGCGVNGALNIVLKGLANEFGASGIRVNAVAPGMISSPRARQMADAGMGDPAKGVPLRRLGEPSEIADATVFLASERATYITGQILMVDGGRVESL